MARSFEQIYSEAPPAAVGRLRGFRQMSTSRVMEHHRVLYRMWELDCAAGGDGREAVVFLPTGIGHGEMWFPYMLEFRRFARCVAFSLGDDETPEALAGALLDMLSELGVERFFIVGASVGGLVAQLVAARAPGRVMGLCLALTGTSAACLPDAVRASWQRRRKLARGMRWQSYTPVMRLRMANNLFDAACPEQYQSSQPFWRAYIEETFTEYLYKAQHIAINTALVPNIYRDFRPAAADYPAALPVLLMESGADSTYLPEERAALRSLFPQARDVDVGDYGQLGLQLAEERALPEMEAFIRPLFAGGNSDN